MTKVVIFSNMYPSAEHPTFGIFVDNQVHLLKSAGQDVKVIAITEPGKGKVKKLTKYVSWFLEALFYLMRHRKTIGMTHSHYAFPTGLLSLVGKRLYDIPYVVTVHGGDLDKMAKKSERIANYTKKILQEASKVITVGEKLKEDVIQDYGVSESRVQVMSMGVNTEIFKPMGQEDARIYLDLPLNDQIIVYVGNIIKAKGLEELIDAYVKLKETRKDLALYMIGSQKDEKFVDQLHARIREKGGGNIFFRDPVGQIELAKWMAAGDVLALPSHHEGFGLVALEAMATGVRVVGTDVGGLSYLLKDGIGILVEPKNPASLAEGIAEGLDTEVTREQQEAIQRIVQSHSYEVILEQLISIYESSKKGTRL